MRIKIIGENNCARATRHLLRLAGFAVTEFLPAEVVTQAPHLGFAITIETSPAAGVPAPEENDASPSMTRAFSEGVTSISGAARPSSSGQEIAARSGLAPAPQPLTSSFAPKAGTAADFSAAAPRFGAGEESPTSQPDASTHGQTAVRGEAPGLVSGASSPAFFSDGRDERDGGNGQVYVEDRKSKQAEACSTFSSEIENVRDLENGQAFAKDVKNKQAEACSTGVIHFDSVDSELEAAVLRHVAQLAAAPVMVDRPGGVVHSERELRIILPVTGNARMDEAAAVAVEFGVLRGLLDLTRRPSRSELSAGAGGAGSGKGGKLGEARGGKSRWWIFGAALAAIALALFGAALDASPRTVEGGGAKGAQAETRATGSGPSRNASLGNSGAGFSLRGLAQPVARRAAMAAAASLTPVAFSAAAEPQGQFATGQGGTNSLDPCQSQTKLFVSINQTANTQLASGTASKKIYVCSIHVVVAAATSVALVEGTGTICGTGTAGVSGFGGATAATGWTFMANGGIALGNGGAAVGAEGTSADNLCLFNSGSGQVSGGISYVVQ